MQSRCVGGESKCRSIRVFRQHLINIYSNCATSATCFFRCFRKCALQSLLSTIELAYSS